MRYSATLCALALTYSPYAQASESELDQFEEKAIARSAEQAVKAGHSDQTRWMKVLEVAFPGKVTNATKEEEYTAWFDLLAGRKEEWRRDASTNPQITDLFDKVIQRMELGPVPSIKRDEFKRYVRHVLLREQRRNNETPDLNNDADKVFRALDRNGDSELAQDELTLFLRDEKRRADADGNGRINKDEYRDYFRRKVTSKAETLAVTKSNDAGRGSDTRSSTKPGKPDAGVLVPEWFATLDTDKDAQISLFEWRQDSRSIATFQEMDLNSDGLLTKEEYLRFIRLKEIEANQRRREEEK